ncbi:right-handed parallel beta-helix repeat-containing protein [Myxococcaceae bacterium JPH2]|nr:right-handed parallel beta-helix repeat-containing protein [Myxococcaceae bacterium JPH2]
MTRRRGWAGRWWTTVMAGWGGLLLACGQEPPPRESPPEMAWATQAQRVEPGDAEDIFRSRCPTTVPPPRSETLFVANTGTHHEDSPLGSLDNPFTTITAAVKAARPGSIIQVSPGTYPEQVTITPDIAKAGTATAPIILRGATSARPVIVPGPGRVVGSLLMVSLPYWIVESFEVDVRGNPSFAALFEGSTYCSQLINSHLHGGRTGSGVVVNRASNLLIGGTEIHDFWKVGQDSHGVTAKGTSSDVFVVRNNIHDVAGDSVQCQEANGRPAGLYIERNELHDAGENAVDVKGCDVVAIRKNTIHDFPNLALFPWQANTSAAEAVLIHEDATNVSIVGNVISHAGRGVSVGGMAATDHPAGVMIQDNTISDIFNYANRFNGQGIRIVKASGVIVTGNTIERTADAGLRLAADEPLVVSGLAVFNNTLRDMGFFVMLGRTEHHPNLQMDRNRYEGPSGRFVAAGLLYQGDFPVWQAKLAPQGLELNSVRVP